MDCVSACISPDWDHYEITYRFGETTYVIRVENPDHVQSGVVEVNLDGKLLADLCVPWLYDGDVHQVTVRMGHL